MCSPIRGPCTAPRYGTWGRPTTSCPRTSTPCASATGRPRPTARAPTSPPSSAPRSGPASSTTSAGWRCSSTATCRAGIPRRRPRAGWAPLLHPLEEPTRVERQLVLVHFGVAHEGVALLDDRLHALGGPGTEVGPHGATVHDRVLHHDVGPDGHQRGVRAELLAGAPSARA